ncbi:MAG: HD domain-containing protein [Gammaproteobacteria bacterium]|nr:HD domain-containing protein [Gammaproteobacteria bacterium]
MSDSTVIILEIVKGSAQILAVAYLFTLIFRVNIANQKRRDFFHGVTYGLLASLAMVSAFVAQEGIIFDACTVIIGIGSAISGPIAAVTTVGIAIPTRVAIGGPGLNVGIINILIPAIAGSIFWALVITKRILPRRINVWVLGVIIHTLALISFFLLPFQAKDTLSLIAVPFLIVFPLLGLGAYQMLISERERLETVNENIRLTKSRDTALKDLTESLKNTIEAIALTVEKRDPYTSGHQKNVAVLARKIGMEMGLPEHQLLGIWLGAVIHDIGKIYMPAEILNRPGKLTDEEFGLIKLHPKIGAEIVEHIEFPWPIKEIISQHHERLNRSGYPNALKDEEIVLEAKIVAVADVVEAITSHRPYRPALDVEVAIEELSSGRGIIYDERAVDTCLKIIENDTLENILLQDGL